MISRYNFIDETITQFQTICIITFSKDDAESFLADNQKLNYLDCLFLGPNPP